MNFQQAETRFKKLKAQFEAGELTEIEFKAQLEELMVQDEEDNWWMIGYETELWYRHDGEDWVQADPPRASSQKPTPVVTPGSQADVDIKPKIVPQEKAMHKEAEREAGARNQVYKQPVAQKPPAFQPTKPKFRNWMAYGAATTVAIVLCITAVIWLYNFLKPPEPTAPAEEPAVEEPAPAEAPAVEEPAPTEAPEQNVEEVWERVGFEVMPGGALEEAIKGTYAGTTVTVDGAMEGNDPDGVKFQKGVESFENATGINVNYIGNKEFEATISVRVDAGDAPDIADFPQPGKVAQYVDEGVVVDVKSFMQESWLSQQYNQSWRDMATVGGMEAGVFHRFNGKSLVWYPKKAWDAAGYQIPETWDDLMALTQQIADDGDTAWCIGIESQAATGWPATDWTEEMMLRTTSLENYDAWVAGTLPFDSPEVKNAIETWSELWFNDAYVYGGRASITTTYFGDSPAPMFDDPPKCWMHRQGNFITGFFPEGTVAGEDYGFFYFPPVNPAYGKPFLVAGDMMVMFNDRPEVRALMEYFTTPQSAKGWLEGGGALAAHQTATPDMYGVDLERGIAELVLQATSFRFDGSDLMPGEVGAGSFWEHITSYVAGSEDLDKAMKAIDKSWPR